MIVDDDKRGVTRDTTEHPPTEDRIAMQKEWMRSAVQVIPLAPGGKRQTLSHPYRHPKKGFS